MVYIRANLSNPSVMVYCHSPEALYQEDPWELFHYFFTQANMMESEVVCQEARFAAELCLEKKVKLKSFGYAEIS